MSNLSEEGREEAQGEAKLAWGGGGFRRVAFIAELHWGCHGGNRSYCYLVEDAKRTAENVVLAR